MNAKERMLTALGKGIPDRLPATVHQWQPYHLKTFMRGRSAIEAFRYIGLDIAWEAFRMLPQETPIWRESHETRQTEDGHITEWMIDTPGGRLSYKTGHNEFTTWIVEPMVKRDEDIYLIQKYRPIPRLDLAKVHAEYDEVGDDGILRGSVFGFQAGCWQDACVLHGTEEMIMATFDKPDWVHEFLGILLEQKLRFIEVSLPGAPYDLIETGGGAGSDTVVSPKLHAEFCTPYDFRLHDALHALGFKVTYHTCGGMSKLLDLIVANNCDASETLSPPGIGGDITDPVKIKRELGSKVALIGGLDQLNILSAGSPEDVQREVHRLFKVYGPGGGYIMSVCDHFFHAPVENLEAYVQAAAVCRY